MRCPRCHNEDESWFFEGSQGWYCRKCISFYRQCLEDELSAPSLPPLDKPAHIQWKFQLTERQKKVSRECADYLSRGRNVVLNAVCGAGKTEILLESMEAALNQGKRVGFAIARRQVVLELKERFQSYFPTLRVIAVCGGFTKVLEGDLICCTMHQLYRYPKTFDLLILDETDAFPYHHNEVLEAIAHHSCKGQIVYSTATLDDSLIEKIEKKQAEVVTLNRRPSNRDLAIPVVHFMPYSLWLIGFIHWLHHRKRKGLVFVPTIRLAHRLAKLLRVLVVTGQEEDKDERIEQFRRMNDGLCIATTVLERGVTFENIDVCVLCADHPVFSVASLIQIAGRVGRGIRYPEGRVDFFVSSKSKQVEQCLTLLRRANEAV